MSTEDFFKSAYSDPAASPEIPTGVPTAARVYDYGLGGKDNFAVDRELALAGVREFPEIVRVARENRQFLYRVVRYLAQEAGIRQFLDLGSGLPAAANVHQVAQEFQPEARVAYVDIDPIVLAHGRALLADDDSTTIITADITAPEQVLADEDVQRLIDFTEPVAVLFLSVAHSITNDEEVHAMLRGSLSAVPPGSYVAFTQIVSADQRIGDELSAMANERGMPWKTRSPEQVAGFLKDLEPVEPGLGDISAWRPDPGQPPLSPVDAALRPHLDALGDNRRIWEYGGLLRKP